MPARRAGGPRHGIARVISKNGLCSRSEAERRVRAGRVSFRGRIVADPEFPIAASEAALVSVDGIALGSAQRLYVVLNKPRGLVTTAQDEKGRATVYQCFASANLPWIAPVGRLDQASEGLLLFSNDPEWSAGITGPESHLDKTYHVQVSGQVSLADIASMIAGVEIDGELWGVKSAGILRSGERTTWLNIVLDEGKNRQIRRILDQIGFEVMRLVRVAIGSLELGELRKGEWRFLSSAEVFDLAH